MSASRSSDKDRERSGAHRLTSVTTERRPIRILIGARLPRIVAAVGTWVQLVNRADVLRFTQLLQTFRKGIVRGDVLRAVPIVTRMVRPRCRQAREPLASIRERAFLRSAPA